MMDDKNDRPMLPRSYTQTSLDYDVVQVGHNTADHVNEATRGSILRDQSSADPGTLIPVDIVIRTLGSPIFYRLETYELTSYGCVVYGSDASGQSVDLLPGSSLVDALLLLPPAQLATNRTVEGASKAVSVHFLGKVLERIALPLGQAPTTEEGPQRTLSGYVIRFSQMGADEQEALKSFLARAERHQGSFAPS